MGALLPELQGEGGSSISERNWLRSGGQRLSCSNGGHIGPAVTVTAKGRSWLLLVWLLSSVWFLRRETTSPTRNVGPGSLSLCLNLMALPGTRARWGGAPVVRLMVPRAEGRVCWKGERGRRWDYADEEHERATSGHVGPLCAPEPSPGRAPRRVPRVARLHPAEETGLGQGCAGQAQGYLTDARFGLKGFHFGSVERWQRSAVPALRQLHSLSWPHAALLAPFSFSLHGHAHIHVAPGGLSS